MENMYDKIQVSVGHKAIFGYGISFEEIISIISRYPAFQWLDLAAKIEGFLTVKDRKILNPQIFLAQNLLPPSTIRRLCNHSANSDVCFTLGQLNYLRKLAIAYGRNNDQDTELPMQFADISKALLSVQDLHNRFDVAQGDRFESFCQFIIRNGYLNSNPDPINLFFRARKMYIDLAQKIIFRDGKSFCDFFKEITHLEIERALSLNFALVNPFFQNKEKLLFETTIINPRTFFHELLVNPTVGNSIIDTMIIDFVCAKEIIMKELADNPEIAPLGYNLDIFRKTPLIRLDNGNLVCANLSCLLQKITQNLIWVPKIIMNGLRKQESDELVNRLTDYRGILFGEYIMQLFTIMKEKNQKIDFFYVDPDMTEDHEEVGDSLLYQDGQLVIIEAKSRQFNESFKYTGDWGKDSHFFKELINKASKQIQCAAEKIKKGQVAALPFQPQEIKRIYPVILTYEQIPMHAKMQRFVRQKTQEYGYLIDGIFAPIEVIYIGDLELFMDCSDSLTLIELLEQKNSSDSHASETNFNNFLTNYLGNHEIISNGWQLDQFKHFTDEIVDPNLIFKN